MKLTPFQFITFPKERGSSKETFSYSNQVLVSAKFILMLSASFSASSFFGLLETRITYTQIRTLPSIPPVIALFPLPENWHCSTGPAWPEVAWQTWLLVDILYPQIVPSIPTRRNIELVGCMHSVWKPFPSLSSISQATCLLEIDQTLTHIRVIVTICLPSLLNPHFRIFPPCPSSVIKHSPETVSQILQCPSFEQVTTAWLSEENAMSFTAPPCPSSILDCNPWMNSPSPPWMAKTLPVPSSLQDARKLLLGEMTTLLTAPPWTTILDARFCSLYFQRMIVPLLSPEARISSPNEQDVTSAE